MVGMAAARSLASTQFRDIGTRSLLCCLPHLAGGGQPSLGSSTSVGRGVWLTGARRWATGRAESKVDGLNSFTTTITANGRMIKSDMPKEGGGDGIEPSPKDLAMAALCACSSMTVQTFAKGLVRTGKLEENALKGVHVVAQDETKAGQHMPESVALTITLIADKDAIPPKVLRMLHAAAAKCPVRRMLEGQMSGGLQETMRVAGDESNQS
mmetsp:Transcript_12289/g.24293  ORF Transcript_12289/g.24293 Transcript_12289/m.24293 type:complete len:211 (-) Transcript_12289:83-715(-)